MKRSTRLTCSLVVMAALAAPAIASGQAVPRNGGGTTGSSGSSGSSSSSGSSGSSGSSSSSSGGSSSTESSSRPASDPAPRVPSRIPGNSVDRSSNGRTGNVATSRHAPAPGGVASTPSARVSGGGSSSSDRTGASASVGDQSFAVGRSRGDRPINGRAEARGEIDRPISFPFYGPWGYNYPWYGSGFGWGLGYVSYNPWYYGATSWGFGRYGFWYDPYGYNPYVPYGFGYGSGGYGVEEPEREERRMGSIRLRANEKEARVYIDGALVGTVDEFDGLTNHLELEAGPHRLELKADGYETYTGTVVVAAGKTLTERVNLKKVK